ncbi:MAG: hypothetical protein WCW44_03610 [archaeon]|jgi:hypothetical protein
MDNRLPGIAWMCALFVCIMIGAYFFGQTGITIQSIMTINSFPLLSAILSINFLVFVILASLSLALILIIGKKYTFKYALLFSITGYLIGIILSTILFKQLANVFILMCFGLIAIPAGIVYINKREEELKYFKKIRAASTGAGRMLLILGLGFFFTLLFIGITNQAKLKEEFVPGFLQVTIGDGVTLDDTFQGQLVDALLGSQTQMIDTILGFDEFNSFQTNSDIDGLILKAKLEAIKSNLTSQQTKNIALAKLKEQNIDLGKELIAKINFIKQVSDFVWVLYAISGFLLFTIIGSAIIKNLSAIFYTILFFAFPEVHIKKGETE